MLSNLLLSFLVFSLCFPSCFPPLVAAPPPHALQFPSDGSRPHLPKLDLEQWYQELMAGSQLCPPPLPAKSLSGRRPVLQVQGRSSSSSSSLFLFSLSVCLSSAGVCVRFIPSTCFNFTSKESARCNDAAFTSHRERSLPRRSLPR